MLQRLQHAQMAAIEHYGRERIRESNSIAHVITATTMLSKLMDAETRHVSLSAFGLDDALASVFIECLGALRGQTLDDTQMPMGIDDLCRALRVGIFQPRNEKYGNTFGNFGAVGVVIRLLDHAQVLGTTGNLMSAAHMANYAAMAMILLLDRDPEFLS